MATFEYSVAAAMITEETVHFSLRKGRESFVGLLREERKSLSLKESIHQTLLKKRYV